MKTNRFRWLICVATGLLCSTGILCAAATPDNSPTTAPSASSGRSAESAVTPKERPGKQVAKLHKAIQTAKTKNPDAKVVILGDSITSRWPQYGPDSWKQMEAMGALNEGLSGDSTENVLWRLDNGDLDGIHPKALVILIGINNLWHNADEKPEWAAAGIKKILDKVQEKLPNTKILLMATFPAGEAAANFSDRDRVAQMNAITAKFADGDKIRFLDLTGKFKSPDGSIASDVLSDGVHPAPKGYDIWLNGMQPVLAEMLK